MHVRKYNLLAVFVALAIAITAAPAAAESLAPAAPASASVAVLTGRTMGTTYRIKYWGEGAATSQQVQREVDDLLGKFDRQMSNYRDDSELSRFNRAPARQWFDVSKETAYVVAQSIEYHRLTGGALDVTVAPLLRLWGFGPGAEKRHDIIPPSAAQLEKALACVGADRLQARMNPPALWKETACVELDLSALAPGYAVDLLIGRLRSLGFANAMVEVGGEVRATGMRPDGAPWRIGVERVAHAESKERTLARVVPLDKLALSTAGDYRNFRTASGKRYTHVIDPRTGQALPYRGASVTVVADSCLRSDALDTALLVMGAEEGYKWCVEHRVAALFQDGLTGGGVRTTPRFDELFGKQ